MKFVRIAALGALVLLSGCLLTPGKFDAALTVRKDGSFTYHYTGEIVLMTGQSFADLGAGPAEEAFDPATQVCTDEGMSGDLEAVARECTAAEIETKRKEWEAGKADRARDKKAEDERTRAMFGGMDVSDPKTMDDFARRLQGYEGWKRVVHKGKGVFEVDYEVSARLDHDFVFPVFPTIDFIIPFVEVNRAVGGKVRISAPAFVQGSDSSLRAFAGNQGGSMGGGTGGDLPRPQGRFTVTTDAEVLTNNTQEGPAPGAGGTRVLTWTVGPLDAKKPEALLQLR
jgi:hypothetical protein